MIKGCFFQGRNSESEGGKRLGDRGQAAVIKVFWSQDSFTLLKIYWGPKELLFM